MKRNLLLIINMEIFDYLFSNNNNYVFYKTNRNCQNTSKYFLKQLLTKHVSEL